VALLRRHGNREVARFESLVHPQRAVPPTAAAVHGITEAMLADAPPFPAVLPRMRELLQGAIVVGHNVRFDVRFLRHEWQAAAQTFTEPVLIDTLALAQTYYSFASNSLGAIAEALGVAHLPQHRAMADVLATWQILDRFIADMRQAGPVTLAHLMAPSHKSSATDLTAMMATLQQALPDKTPLHLRYRGWRAPETVRVVQPLAVYYEGGHGFLRAFCHLRREERSFRFDRIAELTVFSED
jgi:DNA polymerase III epsilon subunit family exonuclease